MRFAEADPTSGYLIQGYEAGAIQIAGQTYRKGLIVTPRRIIEGWGPATAAALTADQIAALLALTPQVIVLGTGRQQIFPDLSCYAAVLERGIGIEIMDTGAACRTYNILVAEGRQVVAGLMMI